MTGQSALKRLIAFVGLILMVPLGLGLVSGSLTPGDAGMRAAALFVTVMVARKLAALAPDEVPPSRRSEAETAEV
ncbi:MAG: hypothetical protein OEX04_21100 [Acidimicrobiia bacterium]|nr:hypothetical protein [Acidimicrobiia bacterium]MDH4309979.1 hypothetical protein [Acidimicrobiia bacterium]MDH5292787.1 hypothetical protein [Acidimicrobiia bacterium]